MNETSKNVGAPMMPNQPKGSKSKLLVIILAVLAVVVVGLVVFLLLPKGEKEEVKEEKQIVLSESPKVVYYPESKKFTSGDKTMEMVSISGGSFWMGPSGSLDYKSRSNEFPVHEVTLSAFYISDTEIPQWLWEAVMKSNPSSHVGEDFPVEMVSYNDAIDFITKLNEMTGEKFNLPTEAQWEYAAREGTGSTDYFYSGSHNPDLVAWYKKNADGQSHAVGTKKPNTKGIYDMSGNVNEWVLDYHGTYSYYSQKDPTGPASGSSRSARGGSYKWDDNLLRVCARAGCAPTYKCDDLGFRIVLN